MESDEDREKRAALQVPVPDVIQTLTLKTLYGRSSERHHVASSDLIGTLVNTALEINGHSIDGPPERVQLVSFGRALEANKKFSDYPGIHLEPIFTRTRLF